MNAEALLPAALAVASIGCCVWAIVSVRRTRDEYDRVEGEMRRNLNRAEQATIEAAEKLRRTERDLEAARKRVAQLAQRISRERPLVHILDDLILRFDERNMAPITKIYLSGDLKREFVFEGLDGERVPAHSDSNLAPRMHLLGIPFEVDPSLKLNEVRIAFEGIESRDYPVSGPLHIPFA